MKMFNEAIKSEDVISENRQHILSTPILSDIYKELEKYYSAEVLPESSDELFEKLLSFTSRKRQQKKTIEELAFNNEKTVYKDGFITEKKNQENYVSFFPLNMEYSDKIKIDLKERLFNKWMSDVITSMKFTSKRTNNKSEISHNHITNNIAS